MQKGKREGKKHVIKGKALKAAEIAAKHVRARRWIIWIGAAEGAAGRGGEGGGNAEVG